MGSVGACAERVGGTAERGGGAWLDGWGVVRQRVRDGRRRDA